MINKDPCLVSDNRIEHLTLGYDDEGRYRCSDCGTELEDKRIREVLIIQN